LPALSLPPSKKQSHPLSVEPAFTAANRHYAALPAAALWRRLAALVYDGLLLIALGFAYSGIVLTVQVQFFGTHEAQPLGELGLAGLWLCLSLYYIWCWRRAGQTLGMKTWRLRLQQPDGSPPTWGQAWLRCLLAPLALVSVVGYLWCLWSASGDCLHDLGSGTRLVVLPKSR
jgi:uncharacterized RDD family membrane protein YckC